ncbi:MAG: class I SAM-dependent methyltransferase [Candidatus Aminicenantes bacterium]|nr:class I SAM-dependent methyltransferase [Candidatus Aminicenantes bacterium]
MNYDNVRKKNLAYFTRTLEESLDEHHAVGQSELSHMKRFEKILELGDFNGKRLLDVGCGVGGLYRFLKEKGIDCDYSGVDINPGMIASAREKYPENKDKFFLFDILEKQMTETFDYVIAVGPLNLVFETLRNMDFTLRLMKEMYRLAIVGSAISMTSSFTRKPNDETFYYDPAAVLSETAKFCVNVKIDHTYLPHDFTIFCYKSDLYIT